MNQPTAESDRQASDEGARGRARRFRAFLLLVLAGVAALGFLGLRLGLPRQAQPLDPTLVALATGMRNTVTPSGTTTNPPPSATFTPAATRSAILGTVIYAGRFNGYTHLWALVPGDPRPVQLSRGEWDDRDPAVSPDGTQVAFASHRDGNWDLYLLDLHSLAIRRLTDTPGYEGHPTWSPDGRWIAYEALAGADFDIWILAVDGSQRLQLGHPGDDTSPAWDPHGRRIAFVSSAEGISDVFLANLDDPSNRFIKLAASEAEVVQDPAFSPDGGRLAYSMRDATDGAGSIQVIALDDPARPAVRLGPGDSPTWSPDGATILGILPSPAGSSVVAYAPGGQATVPFGFSIEGPISSLAWTSAGLPGEAYAAGLDPSGAIAAATETPSPSSIRLDLASLPGVAAPRALLVGGAASAFEGLYARVARDSGWDFLSVLDNAFVGLNDPLPPGFAFEDWLFTGRAFAFAQAAYNAGWVEVVREDFGGETYWRVFVRANRQDGSQGEPLRLRPWDYSVRYTGDPAAYDAGGGLRGTTPSGYYVDFTQLAADQGFRRLPAMANWRTFFPGARFSEFARTDGFTWMDAMLQIYPASAIVTPTPFRTPTPTPTFTLVPTATPWWWGWRTPTPSRTPTSAPTPTP